MTKDQFIEEVYEIAFGDNAINRDFSFEEVLQELLRFSDEALKWEDIPYIDKVRLDPDFEPTDQEMMSSFGTKPIYNLMISCIKLAINDKQVNIFFRDFDRVNGSFVSFLHNPSCHFVPKLDIIS